VLSLGGVLDARKTHTMSDNNKIMVAESCELGICDRCGEGWWLWKEGNCWDTDGGWVAEGMGDVSVLCVVGDGDWFVVGLVFVIEFGW